MVSTISFFAAHDDDVALREYAKSVGLTLLHPYAPKLSPQENDASFLNPIQGGFFSYLPLELLHPRATGELCEVVDPLISYVRPYYAAPSLVAGHLFQNTDLSDLAKQTKPHFQRLRMWIQANWELQEDGYFIGPDAMRILREENATLSYIPSDVTIKKVRV